MLKGVSTINYPKSLTANTFVNYFKSVNDPEGRFYQADEDVIFFNERYLNE